MADQKIENLLNLALNATRREREKSLELDVGYSRDDKEWELIVKYSGTLNELREIGIQVVELSNEFAILTVPESLVERLADFPQIEKAETIIFSGSKREKSILCATSAEPSIFIVWFRGSCCNYRLRNRLYKSGFSQ